LLTTFYRPGTPTQDPSHPDAEPGAQTILQPNNSKRRCRLVSYLDIFLVNNVIVRVIDAEKEKWFFQALKSKLLFSREVVINQQNLAFTAVFNET